MEKKKDGLKRVNPYELNELITFHHFVPVISAWSFGKCCMCNAVVTYIVDGLWKAQDNISFFKKTAIVKMQLVHFLLQSVHV